MRATQNDTATHSYGAVEYLEIDSCLVVRRCPSPQNTDLQAHDTSQLVGADIFGTGHRSYCTSKYSLTFPQWLLGEILKVPQVCVGRPSTNISGLIQATVRFGTGHSEFVYLYWGSAALQV